MLQPQMSVMLHYHIADMGKETVKMSYLDVHEEQCIHEWLIFFGHVSHQVQLA